VTVNVAERLVVISNSSLSSSEPAAKGIGPIEIAKPRAFIRAMDGVEVLALDPLDAWVPQRELTCPQT
jgi:hypothetical protein